MNGKKKFFLLTFRQIHEKDSLSFYKLDKIWLLKIRINKKVCPHLDGYHLNEGKLKRNVRIKD